MISVIDFIKTSDIENALHRCQKLSLFLSHQPGYICTDSYHINNDANLDMLYDDVAHASYRLVNTSQWKKAGDYEQAVYQKEFIQLNQKGQDIINTCHYHVLHSSGDTQNFTISNLVIVTLFKVKAEETGSFIETWMLSKNYMQKQCGFISAILQQSISNGSPYSFVNISQWTSQHEFVAAVKTSDFAQLHKRIATYESQPHFCVRPKLEREISKEKV